jgi:nucleotide-binding universal stress UspA family protein
MEYETMFNNILLASDGSDNALRAAMAAGDLAKKYGSRVTVVHVYMPPTQFAPIIGAEGVTFDAAVLNEIMTTTQDSVSRRTGKILEETGVKYEVRQEVGHPAESIIRVAEEQKADLIVLGSRGLSAVKSFFLGSVSDRVVHHAHCPVLIVK